MLEGSSRFKKFQDGSRHKGCYKVLEGFIKFKKVLEGSILFNEA